MAGARALAATEATLVQETLENFARSAKLFVDASDERRIELADDAVPAALRLMAKRFERAASASKEQRLQILHALAGAQVQERCQTLIREAAHSSDPIHGSQLAGWLECEGIS